MTKGSQLTLPWEFLLGDVVGSLLLGFGLLEELAQTDFVPLHWRFPNYGWAMVALGIVLMIPCTLFLVTVPTSARKKVRGQETL